VARTATTRLITATVALVLLPWSPAFAQVAGESNDQRRQEVERQLGLARKSNAAVEAETARLDAAVTRQQAAAAAARQAEEAAAAQAEAAARRLAEIEAKAAGTRAELARRAVAAYVHPRAGAELSVFGESSSLAEAAQRRTLMAVIQGRTADVIGELRAVREDQAVATEELDRARRSAAERAEAEAESTARLVAEQRAQRAAHDELARRIAGLQAENDALAAEAAALEARIRQRSAAPQPSAGPAPARPASGAGWGFVWPVDGVLTSAYGPRWGSFHAGIDIGAPGGAPIAAAAAGVVISAGWLGAYGNLVVIDHGGGVVTAYAHQSRIAVADGQRVGRGEVVGYVGSTGVSTGDHLHFEVRVGGSTRDPLGYLP